MIPVDLHSWLAKIFGQRIPGRSKTWRSNAAARPPGSVDTARQGNRGDSRCCGALLNWVTSEWWLMMVNGIIGDYVVNRG